jgi:hypothetical protein
MRLIGLATIAAAVLLGACGREEPPTPQAASTSDDRVKNAQQEQR